MPFARLLLKFSAVSAAHIGRNRLEFSVYAAGRVISSPITDRMLVPLGRRIFKAALNTGAFSGYVQGSLEYGGLRLVSRLVEANILREITGQTRNRAFAYQSYINLFSDAPPPT